MPIRINPVYKFRPCVLTFEDIHKIANLVNTDFSSSLYSATDKIWEIFGEPKETFFAEISQRDTLDSFKISATSQDAEDIREINIIFDDEKACITCTADQKQERWFEHFVDDLKKIIRPPTFAQMMSQGNVYLDFATTIALSALNVNVSTSTSTSTPYCRIVIKQRPPNQLIESIKANIVSNMIWALLVFCFGIASTLVTQKLILKQATDVVGGTEDSLLTPAQEESAAE